MSHDPFAPVVLPEPGASNSGNGRTIAIVVAAVVVAALLVAGVIGAVWMLNRDGDGLAAAASATPTPEESVSPSPTPEATEEPTSPSPTPEVTEDPTGPSPTPEVDQPEINPSAGPEVDQDGLARAEALGFSPVAYEMDIDEIDEYYTELQTSLKLFEDLIPATEEGAEYVHAFKIVIADHKAAARFGSAFEGESRDEFAAIELQFLAVSDMDVDITITNSDGSVFRHEGKAPKPVD